MKFSNITELWEINGHLADLTVLALSIYLTTSKRRFRKGSRKQNVRISGTLLDPAPARLPFSEPSLTPLCPFFYNWQPELHTVFQMQSYMPPGPGALFS